MKVYVLETGCYDYRDVRNVYATPEGAMAAHALTRPPNDRQTYVWTRDERWPDRWSFDADWEDAAEIIEYEVLP